MPADDRERLTILEMEYALVAARLASIDARLGVIDQRLGKVDQIATDVRGLRDNEDRLHRMLAEVVRHLGLEGPGGRADQ